MVANELPHRCYAKQNLTGDGRFEDAAVSVTTNWFAVPNSTAATNRVFLG